MKHSIRGKDGKFASVNKPQAKSKAKKNTSSKSNNTTIAVASREPITKRFGKQTTPVAPSVVAKLLNRVAIVLDKSPSIYQYGITDACLNAFNDQLNQLKASCHEHNQTGIINGYTFDESVTNIFKDTYHEAVPYLTKFNYNTQSGSATALLDAVGQAAADLEKHMANDPADTGYLMIVISDGEENNSRTFNKTSIAALISRLQATGRFTFAFSGPRGSKAWYTKLGVPSENCQEWEQTVKGTETMAVANSAAIGTYSTMRARGGTSTQTFYTDLSSVTTQDLRNLIDVTSKYVEFPVDANPNRSVPIGKEEITDFVNRKLAEPVWSGIRRAVGGTYQIGKAFYELVKTEKMQNHKDLIIKDMVKGKLYTGAEARALVGIDEKDTEVKVTPGNNGKFKIYVKSTSTNRHVTPGTVILYSNGT